MGHPKKPSNIPTKEVVEVKKPNPQKLSKIETIEELEEYAQMADAPDIGEKFEFEMIKHVDPLDEQVVETVNGGRLPLEQKEPKKAKMMFRPWNIIGVNWDKKVSMLKFFFNSAHKKGLMELSNEVLNHLKLNINSQDWIRQFSLIVKKEFNNSTYAVVKPDIYNGFSDIYKSIVKYDQGRIIFDDKTFGNNTSKELALLMYILTTHKELNILRFVDENGLLKQLLTEKHTGVQTDKVLQFVHSIFFHWDKMNVFTLEEYDALTDDEKELIHAKR